ncbi:MAG: hypothetical protein H6827_10630 [Planctomycetes bacterium]|nr:hypothetical protein [Planctomycetota bacterium]
MSKTVEHLKTPTVAVSGRAYGRPPIRLAIAWDRIDDVLEPNVRELADKGEWEAPKRRAMARMFERWSR